MSMTLLGASVLFAQEDSSGATAAASAPSSSDGTMLTPPPISGQGYSMGFTSETRSNYLRGGLIFGSAYDSDATTGTNGKPIGEMSYSIWPTIALDQTRSRLHWVLTYSPGFTFYQKTSWTQSGRPELMVENFSYRLSPHVTLSAARYFSADVQRAKSAGVQTLNSQFLVEFLFPIIR